MILTNLFIHSNRWRNTIRLVFITGFFLFTACGDETVTDQTVVARIGDQAITAHDFRIQYELAPPGVKPTAKDIIQRKREFLQRIAEDKLYALAGEENGLDKAPEVEKVLKWYEKKAVIRELYRDEIKDRVKVDEAELRQAFVMLNQRLYLRQIVVKTEPQAREIYRRLQNGESYEDIAMSLASSEEELQHYLTPQQFTWGDLDENFETAVFGLNLKETSAPIKTAAGYHLVQLVNRTRNLLLTEYDYQSRRHYVETIIRRRREAQLAKEYLHRLGEKLHPRANGPVLLKLSKRAQSALMQNEHHKPVPPYAQYPLVLPGIQDLLGETLVIYEGGMWTVEDFFNRVKQMPPDKRPDLSDPGKLQVALALMVRDEFLAQEGYRRELEHRPAVQAEVERIREDILTEKMRHTLLDTVQISDREIRQFYEKNITRYQIPETINIREIMVRKRPLADSLYRLIRQGADMAKLAKQYSVRKWAAKKGGELGYFSRDAFGSVGKAAFQRNVGELSPPVPVKIDTFTVGYSVFRVIDRKPAITQPFEKIYNKVAADALKGKKQLTEERFLTALRKKYPVWLNEDALTSIQTTDELGTGRAMDFVVMRKD